MYFFFRITRQILAPYVILVLFQRDISTNVEITKKGRFFSAVAWDMHYSPQITFP